MTLRDKSSLGPGFELLSRTPCRSRATLHGQARYRADSFGHLPWCGSGRRHLGQDRQAQVQALVADLSHLAEFASRCRRQRTGDGERHLPGFLAAEAAPDLRTRRLQPHRPLGLILD
jgi:hypothetical protein